MYLVRTDASGNLVWARYYGGPGIEEGYALAIADDGAIVVTGYSSDVSGSGFLDVLLMKIGQSGGLQFFRVFGASGFDIGKKIIKSYDGGFVITGFSNSFGGGSDDIFLVKTNQGGTLAWMKVYGAGNYDYGYDIALTSDSGFIIVGESQGVGLDKTDVYVIKTDISGISGCNELDTVAFSGIYTPSFGTGTISSTGAFVGNQTFIEGLPATIDSTICYGDGTSIPENFYVPPLVTLFPNPANHEIILSFPEPIDKPQTIRIFNINGEIVFEQKSVSLLVKNSLCIDLRDKPDGIYFISVSPLGYRDKFIISKL